MLKTIFFDLDNTLWDHDAAQEFAIQKVYENISHIYGITGGAEQFAKIYTLCNDQLWAAYRHGKVAKEEIRLSRFLKLLQAYDINDSNLAENISQMYLEIYPTSTILIKDAIAVLKALENRYTLGIISNGFSRVQDEKLIGSNLKQYFSYIVKSEDVGKPKPDPVIFYHALEKSGVRAEEALFIGDDYDADIVGAVNVGIQTIWFCPKADVRQTSKNLSDYRVEELKEIIPIIDKIALERGL